MIVKRVGPVSCAKIAGTLYAILGLIVGAIFSLVAMATSMVSEARGAAGFGTFIGAGSIILFPILYGVMGFLFTLMFAALYNLIAGMVGGVELDLQ